MATNDLYQSTFMPIFQKAETKIKTLILTAFLLQTSLVLLRNQINGVIHWAASNIPSTLRDKSAYIKGLKHKSEVYILLYYTKPTRRFSTVKKQLLATKPKDIKILKVDNPKELVELVSKPKDLWAEAKGVPNVVNYDKELKAKLQEFAENPMTTFEPGKKPISLWQKAELDVRYDKQMEMLDDLKAKGVKYAWTSSHPNCSKRCEQWQGKLMDLESHAKGSNHLVCYLDGHPVYSLVDIMAKVDKYGYHNNIICGFNCRHHLIPYEKGKIGPEKYTEKDVAKQRSIEERIRVMERNIRNLKTQALLLEKAGLIKDSKNIKNSVKILIDKYKRFCEANGYAWWQYRIDIM